MFDGTYAKKLIDLGRADARAQRDELAEFLFGASAASEVSRG
jgi:hypothetical protein